MPTVFEQLPESTRALLAHEEQDLELRAVELGVHRYRQLRTKGHSGGTTPELRLIEYIMDAVIPIVEKTQREVCNGKAMRRLRDWGVPLLSLSAEKLALISTSVAVTEAMAPANTFTTTSLMIGAAIKRERELSVVKKNAPDVYKSLQRRAKKFDTKAYSRLRVHSLAADGRWTKTEKIALGAKLLEIILEYTDVFTHSMVPTKGTTVGRISIKPEIVKTLEEMHGRFEILRPQYFPMLVPPIPHKVGTNEGGYLWHRDPLIDSGEGNGDPAATSCQRFVDAINVIQSVEWKISSLTHVLLREVWAQGGGIAGLPTAEPIPLPAKPLDFKTNTDAKAKWTAAARETYDKNAEMRSHRVSVLGHLRAAESLSKFPVLHFPHKTDFRLRAYPKPGPIQPQADDIGRSLLRFAEKIPLGEDGLEAIEIHLANCCGKDKVSFEDRHAFVEELFKSGTLRDWVHHPLESAGWQSVDAPWQALEAAREYLAAKSSRDHRYYESDLRVAQDASCSGLQHFSAIGRDEVGGKYVNLIPGDKPEDVYRVVAERVDIKVRHDCEEQKIPDDPKLRRLYEEFGHPALMWRGRITRDTAKRGVMTTPYGVTRAGLRQQFVKDKHTEGMANESLASQYMRDVMYDTISEVVVSARKHMDWLRSCAEIIGETGQVLAWRAPIGEMVTQNYLQRIQRRVVTMVQTVHLREPHPDMLIDVDAQVRGIAPNMIHSFDASHLYAVVLAAHAQAIRSQGVVHDEFGCHAANYRRYGRIIRECFVKQYEGDVLEDIRGDWMKRYRVDLPELPEKGSLDLSGVLRSKYAFH